jgi:argininosuccinate lyase
MKGLPSTYNKDLQEDKEPLFDAADTLETLLPALIGTVETMKFDAAKMLAGLDEGMLATDVADYLVAHGVPFREAHGIVGRLVRHSLETNTPLSQISFDVYRQLSPVFDEDVLDVFNYTTSISKRSTIGGTAPAAVRAQIDEAEKWLGRAEQPA